MSTFQYFGRHRRNLRVKERVEVLLCLTSINEERMRDIEQAGVIVNQSTWRFIGTGQRFIDEGYNVVGAKEQLTAFE